MRCCDEQFLRLGRCLIFLGLHRVFCLVCWMGSSLRGWQPAMTQKVYYRKVPQGFIPADDFARQEFSKLEDNRVYRIQVSKPRSGKQHRLFMGLCAKIADNIDGATTQAMYTYLKGRLGHCDIIQLPNGDKVRSYKSIAFDKMPQDEFQKFMDSAVELICSELIPGLNNQELMDEVNNILD